MSILTSVDLFPGPEPPPEGGTLDSPGVERYPAVVLRADIVGFTSITETATTAGMSGAENLGGIVDRCIGRMTEIVTLHGGAVVAIAGDAITAAWRLGHPRDSVVTGQWALQAAAMIQAEAANWHFESSPIRLRSAVAAGEVDRFRVGTADWGWHEITSGPAIAEAVAISGSAMPGDVVASQHVWDQLKSRSRGRARADGATVLDRVLSPIDLPVRPADPDAPSGGPGDAGGGAARPETLSGEFRQVSVIFSQLRHPFYARPEDALHQLQEATRRAQECVLGLEGALYKMTADENVTTAVTIFGLSPWAHEDDSSRAVEAALALHRAWSGLGATTSSGVATGRVYCTVYGRGAARASAVIGSTMNLAARLMQTSQGVVCDNATAQASRRHHRFELRKLAPRAVKGRSDLVTAFVPIATELAGLAPEGPNGLIGRDVESRTLGDALDRLQAGEGGAFLLEGDAGLGKSSLVGDLVRGARERGIQSFVGRAIPTEQQVAYGAWRGVYGMLLENLSRLATQQPFAAGSIYAALREDAPLAPLLNDVRNANLGETLETSRLSGEVRSTATRDLLVRCMERSAESGPLLIVLEDLHWIDSTSLDLLSRLLYSALPLLLVATSRPDHSLDGHHRALLASAQWTRLTLQAFSVDQTGQLLAQRLGAQSCEPDAAALVERRTGGNPLFIEEMALFLRENGILAVQDGCVSVSVPEEAVREAVDALLLPAGAPGTLESVVLARFDRLSETEQLVLRAASVVGSTCSHELLRVELAEVSPEALNDAVGCLMTAGFLSSTEGMALAFKHDLLRDIIYHSMAFADRRRYHAIVARWLVEDARSTTRVPDHAVIGHHFFAAGELESAVEQLLQAGEQALRGYANVEACQLLEQALEIHSTVSHTASADRRAPSSTRTGQIHLDLARANLGLSRYAELTSHAEAGLALLGDAVPSTGIGLLAGVGRQAGVQALHRVAPLRVSRADPIRRETAGIIALALESLTEAYFYRMDAIRALYTALRTLNIAEQWELLPQQARGYATLAGISSVSPFPAVSAYYRSRALETLTRLDDPEAAVWVYIVIGLSLTGLGEWREAAREFAQAANLAESVGDRRRWRDGVGNLASVAACQGEWERAFTTASSVQAAATRDKDQRYQVLTLREEGYYLLHLFRFDEVRIRVERVEQELERGISAEEGATRLDVHALRGTLALQAGDPASARASADAALAEILSVPAAATLPYAYWSRFLTARLFLNLLRRAQRTERGSESEELARQASSACGALENQARVHLIAAPAALLCRGVLDWQRGRTARAQRRWRLSLERATRLAMPYERSLAERQLASQPGTSPAVASGLPLYTEGIP